jgi:hypothetical protein
MEDITHQAQSLVVKTSMLPTHKFKYLTSIPKGAYNNVHQTHTFNSLYISFLYTKPL